MKPREEDMDKKHKYVVRLDGETHAALRAQSASERRSIQAVLECAVMNYIKRVAERGGAGQ